MNYVAGAIALAGAMVASVIAWSGQQQAGATRCATLMGGFHWVDRDDALRGFADPDCPSSEHLGRVSSFSN